MKVLFSSESQEVFDIDCSIVKEGLRVLVITCCDEEHVTNCISTFNLRLARNGYSTEDLLESKLLGRRLRGYILHQLNFIAQVSLLLILAIKKSIQFMRSITY